MKKSVPPHLYTSPLAAAASKFTQNPLSERPPPVPPVPPPIQLV
jgi:hypothetical protein